VYESAPTIAPGGDLVPADLGDETGSKMPVAERDDFLGGSALLNLHRQLSELQQLRKAVRTAEQAAARSCGRWGDRLVPDRKTHRNARSGGRGNRLG
jgi:hypothetical protein